MNNKFLLLGSLTILNLILSCWMLFQYKNAPPVEENIRVRVGQSDRFIAENANKIESMKGEISALKAELTKMSEAMAVHDSRLNAHEQKLKK